MHSSTTSLPVHHGARRRFIAEQLLERIFDGQLSSGTHLVAQRLAEQFGVSPTPVREALLELGATGMVELVPNCGAIVRPFGVQQVRDICHLRQILETEAARCACGRIDRETLLSLEAELALLAARRPDDWLARTQAADHRLHELIRAHCGNERLSTEIHRYVSLYRALRRVHDARCKVFDDTFRIEENLEHHRVVQALLADAPLDAAQAMCDHIRSAAGNLERGLAGAGQQAAVPL